MKIRLHIKTPLTFWDMRKDIFFGIYEKSIYKHSETIEYVKN